MKTLTLEETKSQIQACGVLIEDGFDVVAEHDAILLSTVADIHQETFTEAKVNLIRHALTQNDQDFTPHDIQIIQHPLSRSVVVYMDQPFIVDHSDKKGTFLISMSGEDFKSAYLDSYPVIGTICV